MDKLSQKIVLITGAGRGAGRAVAEAFAARGATVAANDISPINLDVVAESVVSGGGRIKPYVGDVAKKVAVQALINQVTDDWGRIDVLVNSAAVEPASPLLDMDEWDWHRVLDVNLTGAFLMLQSVGRVMRAQGGGVIINLIPLAGRETLLDRGAYLASKMGLAALTRQAALELGPFGVRVHAVGTGLGAVATVPAAEMDVAAAVLSLCCGESAHLNGEIINIV